jgi:hypothetical protein
MSHCHLIHEFFGMMPAAMTARIEPTTSIEKWEEGPLSHANPVLAELNGIEMQAADVGDACLKAVTLEKVCFIACPEFGEQAGHTLVLCKAFYGLRISQARWGEKFADALCLEGFFPPMLRRPMCVDARCRRHMGACLRLCRQFCYLFEGSKGIL